MATSGGLIVYDAGRNAFGAVPELDGTSGISFLARDAAGRLWLVGERIWLFDAGELFRLPELPILAASEVVAAGAVDGEPHTIALAIDGGGLVFVSADPD